MSSAFRKPQKFGHAIAECAGPVGRQFVIRLILIVAASVDKKSRSTFNKTYGRDYLVLRVVPKSPPSEVILSASHVARSALFLSARLAVMVRLSSFQVALGIVR
jgi:hypothetical protein